MNMPKYDNSPIEPNSKGGLIIALMAPIIAVSLLAILIEIGIIFSSFGLFMILFAMLSLTFIAIAQFLGNGGFVVFWW
jgi:hypothetical protein